MSINLYNILLVPFVAILAIIFLKPTAITHKLQVSPLNSVSTVNVKENLLITLFTTSVFISFVQCLFLYICFNGQVGTYQFLTQLFDTDGWTNPFSLLAIDGISIGFVLLTPFVVFLCAGITHQLPTSFEERKFYYLCLLFIELFLFLAFMTTNIIVFYFSFEAVLLPIFLMLGRWGSNTSKKQAANYMFVYTVFGSVLMLFAIITMIRYYGTSNFTALKAFISTEASPQISFWWWCFFIGFAVKVPVCPFHLWLPEAHVEAPAAGSVILAALLLKLGGYGFLRVLIDILSYQTKINQIFATTFGIVSVLWGCGVILTLTDIKRVIAFSSIIHMNLTVIGTFAFNYQGIQGAIAVMISHALCSAGLFMCIGMLYIRYHTRALPTLTGLAKVMPVFVFVFGVYSLANMALPGTFNFVGEIVLLQGIFLNDPINALICCYSVVFSAAYSLELFSRICFGTLTNYFKIFYDIDDKPYLPSWYTEFKWQLPLLVPIIFFGIYPAEILSMLDASVINLLHNTSHEPVVVALLGTSLRSAKTRTRGLHLLAALLKLCSLLFCLCIVVNMQLIIIISVYTAWSFIGDQLAALYILLADWCNTNWDALLNAVLGVLASGIGHYNVLGFNSSASSVFDEMNNHTRLVGERNDRKFGLPQYGGPHGRRHRGIIRVEEVLPTPQTQPWYKRWMNMQVWDNEEERRAIIRYPNGAPTRRECMCACCVVAVGTAVTHVVQWWRGE